MRQRLMATMLLVASLTALVAAADEQESRAAPEAETASMNLDSDTRLRANRDFLPFIFNGIETFDYPFVGVLVNEAGSGDRTMICSGTLIGDRHFLTAAHCFDDSSPPEYPCSAQPEDYLVFLQDAGFRSVRSVFLPCGLYNSQSLFGDIALVELDTAFPVQLSVSIELENEPEADSQAVIVGYGKTGAYADDYGIKRFGTVETSACGDEPGEEDKICWEVADGPDRPGENSNTCPGDSGGPLLVGSGDSVRVAGVTSGGTLEGCETGDKSFNTSTVYHSYWLEWALAASGHGAGVEENAYAAWQLETVLQQGKSLLETESHHTYTFEVPADAAYLVVTMNGIDTSYTTTDFDLTVRPPLQQTPARPCIRSGPGQFADCDFFPPAAGTWTVTVGRIKGVGPYQLKALVYRSL